MGGERGDGPAGDGIHAATGRAAPKSAVSIRAMHRS